MSFLKNYYYTITKNLQTNKIFYKYFSKEYTYNHSYEYSKKFLKYLKKNKIQNKVILTFSNKSFEMYSSIFPILISGNIWVPLSINLPIEKIKNVIHQTKPYICFYDYDDDKILSYLKKKIKCINFKKVTSIEYKKKVVFTNEIKKLNTDSTAFIYFTSGSTGMPKGIKISHKNIISDIFAQKENIYKNKVKNLIFGDYYDTAFSIFFDIFFPAIYFGSTIVPSITKSDNFYLIEHFKKNKINTFVSVPSTFNRIKEILNYKKESYFHGKNLILTGEPFYLNLLKFLFRKVKFKNIYNCYGGTEMGNWVFCHKCKLSDIKNYKKFNLVPIGKPFTSVSVKILKKELVVTGPMISEGYIDKKLNLKKFIIKKNNTFYTGDKVKKIKSVYICKGRLDNMLKISGFRIEISDVEANFRKLNYIKDVIIFEKKKGNYNNYLAAVVSLNFKKNEIQIRKDLLKYLSMYMIPRKIYILNSLPKNTNGKIDRAGIIKKFY